MLPTDHVITWEEFRTAFRAHHIPEGLLDRKLNEFLALTQGTRTVLQYAHVFNHLCQYAGHHVDTDAKKQDRFRRGLNTKLKECLNLVRPKSFNELVNMAITQDDCITAHRAEKRKKASTRPSGAQSPSYRLMQNTAPKALLKNAPSGRWIFRPPSSKEQLDSQCLSNSSSRNSLVQGQMINSSIVGTTITIVSIAGVPHTLLEIALNPRNLF